MDQTNCVTPKKILDLAAALEIGAGLTFLVAPTLAVELLIGVHGSPAIAPLGRVIGIALLALGVACWPSRGPRSLPALRGLTLFNLLVAAYLVYLGAIEHLGWPFLWPASALHAVMALLLVWTGPDEMTCPGV